MKTLPLFREPAPKSDGEMLGALNRRRWMQLMGASTALASAGCRYQQAVIQPFAYRPDGYIPGESVLQSALCEIGGIARSLVSSVNDGRPIKVDGNALHPMAFSSQPKTAAGPILTALGGKHDDPVSADKGGEKSDPPERPIYGSSGSTSLVQALTLQMYDPDRSRDVMMKVDSEAGSRMEKASLAQFQAALAKLTAEGDSVFSGQGAGLAILSEPSSSPTLARLKQALVEKFPSLGLYEFAAVNQDAVKIGTKQLFGQTLVPFYHFDKAEVVLALDSDPFGADLHAPEFSRDFMKMRDVEQRGAMSRLWSVGSCMNVTAAMADERLPLATSKVEAFLASLDEALSQEAMPLSPDPAAGPAEAFMAALVHDLKANAGKAIVVVGENQPPAVHALAWKINRQLEAIGSTVSLLPSTDPVGGGSLASLQSLVADCGSGKVKALFVLGGNPVFAAPASFEVGKAIAKLPFSAHLGLYVDETARLCQWHVNQTHCLEDWTDGRTLDGTWCIGQPSINPLFGGLSTSQMLAMLAGSFSENAEIPSSESLVKTTAELDRSKWQKALHDGFVEGTAAEPASPQIANSDLGIVEGEWVAKKKPSPDAAEVVFIPGAVYDGSFANSGWLQELPDPTTKMTWGNAAIMSPTTAIAWGLRQNQMVSIALEAGTLKLPVHLVPGTAAGVIAIAYGYGRTEAGRVGGSSRPAIRCNPVGVDVNLVRTANSWYFAPASVQGTVTYDEIATTQEHHYLDTLSLSVVNERVPRLAREGDLVNFLAYAAAHPSDHGSDGHGSDGHAGVDPAASGMLVVTDAKAAAKKIGGKSGSEDAGDDDGHGENHAADGHGGHGHGAHGWPPQPGHHYPNIDLTPGPAYFESPKWAMSIDLNKCTGCSVCVTACQAENNVMVVGKPEVLKGREMHWIRIDRYFLPRDVAQLTSTDPQQELYDNPKVVMQPVTCHHCEKAPCEQVCPVAATVHSDEGLNDMVYNRCIGTRYCGNNCPYKVRRFNYFNYSNAVTFLKYPDALAGLDGAKRIPEGDLHLRGLMMNPEVTIRSRGVMEKCTFCVQRIQNGKIKARNEGRNFRNGDFKDGEITTACQDACPTGAIVFGDASVKNTQVAKDFESPRAYAMLGELNVVPRLKYLARVRNPHPWLAAAELANA